MIVNGYRITKTKHAAKAFTGEGAKKYPGRWNGAGTSVVYCAAHLSLAVLEILTHLGSEEVLSEKYQYFEVRMDDSLILTLPKNSLPEDWNDDPVPDSTQKIGDRWIASGKSAVLKVPSVIVGIEFNYLINPSHPGFKEIQVMQPKPIIFDSRLLK